jgi:very-short-patch-repair endonuclease
MTPSELVIDLLKYIEEVEKLNSKPTFTVPQEHFCAYQQDLRRLPGLEFDLQGEGDDIWLRMPRLNEISAPDPGEGLSIWVNLPKKPEELPTLKAERTEAVVENGEQKSVVHRVENFPEVEEHFKWYVDNQWAPWSASERPRRETIRQYQKLFALQQQLALEGSDLELVWGLGYTAWKRDNFPTAVRYPLIFQLCEVTLNEKSFDLEVHPRDIGARIDLDCYQAMEVQGAVQLNSFWENFQKLSDARLSPFEALSYVPLLKAAVSNLDEAGNFEALTDGEPMPTPQANLVVSDGWVLFARKRTKDVFLEDVQRLQKYVQEHPDVPAVIQSFVKRGDDTVPSNPPLAFRGLSNSDSSRDAFELYFPMAYNDEQVSIVQRLENNDGVVVQGPPGTGKTHTIANVICHYLANGRRVLVTAKSESALAVLRDKLPEGIRDLSVALLSGETDGKRDFEHSIKTIAAGVAELQPESALREISHLQSTLGELHAKISNVDREAAEFARKHMVKYSFQGREVTSEEMAKMVMTQSDEHSWFDDDLPQTDEMALPLGDSDIGRVRQARIAVKSDLAYLPHSLPPSEDFLGWPELLDLHRDLIKARAIESRETAGELLALVDTTPTTFERAKAFAKVLDERQSLLLAVAQSAKWIAAAGAKMAISKTDDPIYAAVLDISRQVVKLETQRRNLVARSIEAPAKAEADEDFMDAIGRLVTGKSAFVLPFGKSNARALIAGTRVVGDAPRSIEGWKAVAELLAWRVEARKAMVRWNSVGKEFGLEQVTMDVDSSFRSLPAWVEGLQAATRLHVEFEQKLATRTAEVFGKRVAERLSGEKERVITELQVSVAAQLDRGRLGYAMSRVHEQLLKLEGKSGSLTVEIKGFLTGDLGSNEHEELILQTRWMDLIAQLRRLNELRPHLDAIEQAAQKLATAGATKWATRLTTQPVQGDTDALTPGDWIGAWAWRHASQFLERIDGHHRMRKLFAERKSLTAALAKNYQDLVEKKTWLGVHKNSSSGTRQALQAYLTAVQALGAGTGIRAARHRTAAQNAMSMAYMAVPCWVMPQWRVSESIPSVVGLFDLVVIDEASQSDISAMPALLRAKKLLVVGDEKQVSPSAVGVQEAAIKKLQAMHLAKQPHASQMTPDHSVYDLARVVFADNSVMLKEHFRCVPAIIEYSNREFYQNAIRPLRVPKANERLDPPLIDVFVKGGMRKGDVNEGEALAIVDEIEAIIADPLTSGRSIGVVTLMGTKQAARLFKLVHERIAPSDIVARKIAIGAPPVFQGRERDIMLVSMVLDANSTAAASKAEIEQRFNVALSRARDRTYLFRSVDESKFKEGSLNARLLQHFREPFKQDTKRVSVLRERCESGFEEAMYDALVQRGYRVEPQVKAGGFRIDFVVEGNEGRRLAVECDGDRFHGPEQWRDDMARQRVLERAGWTFWRCFGSSFSRNRKEVLGDLFKTLDDLGIEPLGAESVDSTAWTLSKVADPYKIGELDLNEEAEAQAEVEVTPATQGVALDTLLDDEPIAVLAERLQTVLAQTPLACEPEVDQANRA